MRAHIRHEGISDYCVWVWVCHIAFTDSKFLKEHYLVHSSRLDKVCRPLEKENARSVRMYQQTRKDFGKKFLSEDD